jgi:uncharacterized protein YcbK (DUF882 family)
VTRRTFLEALSASVAMLAAPRLGLAAPAGVRELRFLHLHTGERLTIEYFSGGAYAPDALAAVDHLLRDFRTNEIHAIDPALLDLLHRLRSATGSRQPFQVISGYRSPATNEQLRRRNEGVAAGSLHMTGQAIDIRLADVRLKRLRDAALAAKGGGVGYYPRSDFVHVDTGRVRWW